MKNYLNSHILWDELLLGIKHKKPYKKNTEYVLKHVELLSKKLHLYIHTKPEIKKTKSILKELLQIACDTGVDTKKLCKKAIAIMKRKGHDYSNGDLIIYNFLEYKKYKTSPRIAWFVFVIKHIEAVKTYLSSGSLRSETIEERFCDIANYVLLGYVILLYLEKIEY